MSLFGRTFATTVLAAFGGTWWLRERNTATAMQNRLDEQGAENAELRRQLAEREEPDSLWLPSSSNLVAISLWLLSGCVIRRYAAPEKKDFLKARTDDLTMNVIVLLELRGEGGSIVQSACGLYFITIVVESILVAVRVSRRLSRRSKALSLRIARHSDRSPCSADGVEGTAIEGASAEAMLAQLIDFILDKIDICQILLELSFPLNYLSVGFPGFRAALDKCPAGVVKVYYSVHDRWTKDQEAFVAREATKTADLAKVALAQAEQELHDALAQKEHAAMEVAKTKESFHRATQQCVAAERDAGEAILAAEAAALRMAKAKRNARLALQAAKVEAGRSDFGFGVGLCTRCKVITRRRGCNHGGRKMVYCTPCYVAHVSSCPSLACL